MTSKEQAEELVNAYIIVLMEEDTDDLHCSTIARRCALIGVNEILNLFYDKNCNDYRYNFWEEVEQELDKL